MGTFGFFDHDSRDGSEFWQRVQRFYRPGRLQELVGRREPALVVGHDRRRRGAEALDGQPGHRKNILTARWREIGLSALKVAPPRVCTAAATSSSSRPISASAS
jgi:uncharacterized protein YkwD